MNKQLDIKSRMAPILWSPPARMHSHFPVHWLRGFGKKAMNQLRLAIERQVFGEDLRTVVPRVLYIHTWLACQQKMSVGE